MSVAARVLQAISNELAEHGPLLEAMREGTISVIVQTDASGQPKQITLRTESRHAVERQRPCRVAI